MFWKLLWFSLSNVFGTSEDIDKKIVQEVP